MAYNKVMDRNGNILLDLSSDTATEKDVRMGKTFHDNSGNVKQGVLDPTVMEIIDSDIPIFDLSKVNFIDTYTGKLIASYTIEEAKNLTELPPLPNHPEEDLIGDEWSEDLDTLKTISQGLLVGCYYKTGGDYSMYEILVNKDNFTLTLKPYITTLSSTDASMFKVDWGDGNVEEKEVTSTGTSTSTFTHVYEKQGIYRLKLYYNELFEDYDAKMIDPANNTLKIYTSTHQCGFSGKSLNISKILHPKYLYSNRSLIVYSYLFYDVKHMIHTYLAPYKTDFTMQNSLRSTIGTFIIPSIMKFKAYNSQGFGSLYCFNLTITSTGAELSTNQYGYPKLYRAMHTVHLPVAGRITGIRMYSYAKRIIIPEGVHTIDSVHSFGSISFKYVKLPASVTEVSSLAASSNNTYVVDCTLVSDPNKLTAGSTNKFCILVVSDADLDAYKTKFDSYFTVMSYDDYVNSGLQEFYEG